MRVYKEVRDPRHSTAPFWTKIVQIKISLLVRSCRDMFAFAPNSISEIWHLKFHLQYVILVTIFSPFSHSWGGWWPFWKSVVYSYSSYNICSKWRWLKYEMTRGTRESRTCKNTSRYLYIIVLSLRFTRHCTAYKFCTCTLARKYDTCCTNFIVRMCIRHFDVD